MIDTRIFGIELDSAAIYEMVLTLQKYHGQQNRHAGLAPYWHHCVRVGSYLGQALQISHQGKDLNWNTQLIQAALGHDLLEDTEIPEAELKSKGEHLYQWIQTLTNKQGDHDTQNYELQIFKADEPSRLIKLADLLDNLLDASFGAYVFPTDWLENYVLPILEPMLLGIQKTMFSEFDATAQYLFREIASAQSRLEITRQCLKNSVLPAPKRIEILGYFAP